MSDNENCGRDTDRDIDSNRDSQTKQMGGKNLLGEKRSSCAEMD